MRVLNTRVLALAVAALLTIALLFAVPLSGLASARAEARAGDTVAIAGDDDCDVQTNDDDDENNGADSDDTDENDTDNTDGDDTNDDDNTDDGIDDNGTDDGTGDEDGDDDDIDDENNVDEDDGDQAQDEDNGGRVVARAGDAVAIAGGGCESETESIETESIETENVDTEDENTEDVETGDNTEEVEDDDEIEDRTGDPDGDTTDTSELNTLFLGEDGSSDEQTSEETTDEQTSEETTNEQISEETTSGREAAETVARRNGFDFDGKTGTDDEPGSQRERSVRLSSSGPEWPFPTKRELKDRIGETRRFDPAPGADMTLAIRALGLYDVPVTSSNTDKALDRGVVHVPDTAYPWDREDQKNVFIAGHRLGPNKEKSRLVFYSLDELKPGDEIVLKDRKGQPYKYRVRELFKVGPDDAWVADTLVGRDLLTLQTYTLPSSKDRLVVRADRVQPRSEGGEEQRG